MKNTLIFILIAVVLSSCNQDPIFFTISLEVTPLKPRIEGFPSAVMKGAVLYVISKGGAVIHQYNNGNWTELSKGKVSGRLHQLAATDTALYVLAGEIGSLKVWKTTDLSNWTDLSISGDIQAIYGAGDTVFIASRTKSGSSEEFAISYEKDGTVALLQSETALLTGAATDGTNYYLSTAGKGILCYDSSFVLLNEASSLTMRGIIALEDTTIAAVSSTGLLYNTIASPTTFDQKTFDVTFTGAMALWEGNGNKFLLLGVSSSSVDGYREIPLAADGSLSNPETLQMPGKADSTTLEGSDTFERFETGLGLYPVMGLFQAGDAILFAAPLQNGLWSYRERSEGWQWNAESK
ncbi:MAG: hypothetical protein LBB43_01015 [Spirochaetaceae bacterium]|jgi:hypothetical protein|nr:hypothetical protein [Spirochaetaceae bacterium]